MSKVFFVIAFLVSFHLTSHAQTATAHPQRTAATVCPEKNGLTQAEITEIVQAHNSARSQNKLPALTWNCKLASVAQEWATRGIFEHRPVRTYGENLFVSIRSTSKVTEAVQAWLLENSSWNQKTAACMPGKVCTHYTQVVWKKTTTIGCGINRNAGEKWKILLVCNYEPPGNGGGAPF